MIKITENMVGKFINISMGYNDESPEIDIIEAKDLTNSEKYQFELITLEEYQAQLELERRETAKHMIQTAKKWIQQYPDLA